MTSHVLNSSANAPTGAVYDTLGERVSGVLQKALAPHT